MFVRALLFFCLVIPGQAEWPAFRGPTNDGHYPPAADGKSHRFPIEWSEGKNIVWKTPVTGRAWSTPVVMDNEVWVTNATPDGKRMYAVCLDKTTGKKVHDILLFENEAPEPLSNHVNGYGSCSPAIDSEHVYIHFGSYGTTALDRKTGKTVWERRDLPCQHFRGPGSSVVLHKSMIILTMDGVDVQYLIALDRKTGKKVWRSERNTDFGDVEPDGKIRGGGDFRKAYSTPNFVTLNGVRQLVSPGAKACYSYDADTGKELWKVLYKGFSNAAAPVFVGNDMALINTGLGKPHLLGVRLDHETQGDITRSHIEWDIFKRIPGRCSPVVIGSDVTLPPNPASSAFSTLRKDRLKNTLLSKPLSQLLGFMPTITSSLRTKKEKPLSLNLAPNWKSLRPINSTTAVWPRRLSMKKPFTCAPNRTSIGSRKNNTTGKVQ